MRRVIFLALAFALTTPSIAHARKKLELDELLAQPGVKAVALVFIAPWSKPSVADAPKWAALAKKHRGAGLRVMTVGMQDPDRGGCTSPTFGDEIVCDDTGAIAKAWTNNLPGAFLFDWRGRSLGAHQLGDYATLAPKIDAHFKARRTAEIAVVAAEDVPPKLAEQIASELEKRGKFEAVARGGAGSEIPPKTITCPEGQGELAAKTNIRALITDGEERTLLLEAMSGAPPCMLGTGADAWSSTDVPSSVAAAVDKLLDALSMRPGPPAREETNDTPAPREEPLVSEEKEDLEPEQPTTNERKEARALLLSAEATAEYSPLAPAVLKMVEEEYIDPSRVRPERMLRGAIRALTDFYPAIIVKPAPKGDTRVTLNGVSVTIGAAETVDLSELSSEIKEVVELVAKDKAVNAPSRAGLEALMLDGALATLDQQTSRIVGPSEQEARKGELAGRTGGIGVELTMKDNVLRIYAPIEGGPSAKAGLRPGDMIRQIDGAQTSGMTFDDALARLRGDIGSKVAVTVTREGWKKPATYVLVRGTIEPKVIEGKRLPGDIAYVRLRKLSPASVEELIPSFDRLTPRRARLRGLILDLRGTTGTLDSAMAAADTLLSGGDLATVATRKTRDVKVATASERDLSDTPVAVLVDHDTRGAGELLAAALGGSDRALLIGERTRGAASAATNIELPAGFGADVRTKQTLTVGGRKIDEVGLTPDVFVKSAGSTERSFEGGAVVEAPRGPNADEYTIELARKLLDKAGNAKRAAMLRDMRATLDKEKR